MHDDITNYIPISECKNDYLYFIQARNSSIGICTKNGKEFTISRFKFSDNFLFEEDHFDTGEPYGTVKPIKELEQCPEFNNAEEKLKYLNDKMKEYNTSIV
jgi:hypothetical protein